MLTVSNSRGCKLIIFLVSYLSETNNTESIRFSMPPQRNTLQCKANKMLVEKLQGEETMHMESQKDRLAMTFRRAIRSVRE